MRWVFIAVMTGFMTFLLAATAPAGDMRCGNDIVNINESAFIVRQKCGEPVERVHVGYTLDDEKKRELVIEEWVYGPKNDYYYFVTLIGARVAEIRSERR